MSKRHLLVRRPSLFTSFATACGISIHKWGRQDYRNGSVGYALDQLQPIGFTLTDDDGQVNCLNCVKALTNGSYRTRAIPLS